MLIMFLAAVQLATATGTNTPSAAPAPAADKPLREVTYKVSFSRRLNSTAEYFPGDRPDQFGSNVSLSGDNGKVTVDVMQVADNALGLKVTELWNNSAGGRPMTYVGNLAPQGKLNFAPGSISDVTREILPFFAPLFMQDRAPDAGSSWSVRFDRSNIHASTTYTVDGIDGEIMRLSKKEDVKVASVRQNGYTSSGTVRFKPSLLVPVSGEITKRSTQEGASANSQKTLTLHFDRVSDTRDPAPPH